MTNSLIEARNLALRVPIIKQADRSLISNPRRLLSDFYLSRTKRGYASILNNISFELQPGMRLGLIGVNGSGKSTLLRVLAGIYAPTSGSIAVNGVAKGLFDISLGMHQEATGLENIYMRGLQMGLGLKKIKSLIPEVLEFSELSDDIDKPFNTYSAGMRLRLAVAISTMVEPDILLLDEWIGAGDANFKAKVTKRMNSLVSGARGLVLATHNAQLMKHICTHGMVLAKGGVKFFGDVDSALDYYSKEVR